MYSKYVFRNSLYFVIAFEQLRKQKENNVEQVKEYHDIVFLTSDSHDFFLLLLKK